MSKPLVIASFSPHRPRIDFTVRDGEDVHSVCSVYFDDTTWTYNEIIRARLRLKPVILKLWEAHQAGAQLDRFFDPLDEYRRETGYYDRLQQDPSPWEDPPWESAEGKANG